MIRHVKMNAPASWWIFIEIILIHMQICNRFRIIVGNSCMRLLINDFTVAIRVFNFLDNIYYDTMEVCGTFLCFATVFLETNEATKNKN